MASCHSCVLNRSRSWSRTMPFRRLSLYLFTALLAASLLHGQVAGRLSGSVVDQTGAAVPGATVNVYLANGHEPVLTAQTNETGVFSFVTVRPETYDIAVEAKGFTRTMLRAVKVSPVQETALSAI